MSRAYGYTSYGGPETEVWFDRPEPAPGPGELVIKVKAAGVNPADYKIRSGVMANPQATPDFPLVLGIEAAGVVVAVGSFVQAAALPVAGGTAWDALEKLGVTEGETLLINGVGGGVGVMATQLARNRGAAVFGVGSETKRSMTESLGATLVPYDRGDVVKQIRELLPGGVDAILDAVGGEPMRHVAILIINPARIVSIADTRVTELGGSFLRSSSAGVPAVAHLVATGKVDPKVAQTYPFDEAPQALRAVESGRTLGKIVIDLEQTTQV
jgi:NADPH:quinone reductase